VILILNNLELVKKIEIKFTNFFQKTAEAVLCLFTDMKITAVIKK
jgi:hypothetical protein